MKQSRVGISSGAALLFPLLFFLDEGGWFASILPTVVLHEFGHCVAIALCRGKINGLYLDVAGLRLDTVLPLSARQEAYCALAGPIFGLLWCGTLLIWDGDYLEQSAKVSILLNLYNLLPAYPLDGGRCIYALCGSRLLRMTLNMLVSIGLLAFSLYERIFFLIIPAAYLLRSAFTA